MFESEDWRHWFKGLKRKRNLIFVEGMEIYRVHMVHTFPFKHPLPWKQQPCSRMFGPTNEQQVLKEVLKFVEFGIVQKMDHEPYIILVFVVLKKLGVVHLVLDF